MSGSAIFDWIMHTCTYHFYVKPFLFIWRYLLTTNSVMTSFSHFYENSAVRERFVGLMGLWFTNGSRPSALKQGRTYLIGRNFVMARDGQARQWVFDGWWSTDSCDASCCKLSLFLLHRAIHTDAIAPCTDWRIYLSLDAVAIARNDWDWEGED